MQHDGSVVAAWLQGYAAGLIAGRPPDGMGAKEAAHLLAEIDALQLAQEAASADFIGDGARRIREARDLAGRVAGDAV